MRNGRTLRGDGVQMEPFSRMALTNAFPPFAWG